MKNRILNAGNRRFRFKTAPVAKSLLAVMMFLIAAACGNSGGQSSDKMSASVIADPQLINDRLFVLEEYQNGTRELALADVVLERAIDPEIKSLAKTVREGHQLGVDKLTAIAAELKVELPPELATLEQAKVNAVRNMPTDELPRYFLVHQRAIHAYDNSLFADYGDYAVNESLKKYVRETVAPLRQHADEVNRIANSKGIGAAATVK